jgi:hypothetical protein
MRSLAEALDPWKAEDPTVRLVTGLLSVLPFLPSWTHPGSLDQMCGSPKVRAVVDRMAAEQGAQSALNTFDLLDKTDRGIALFSGIKGAVGAVRGTDGTLELEPQQAADAGLKAAGIAYATWKLFGGDPGKLTGSSAGQALLAWYVAADVVLPFADNLASGGIDVMGSLVDRYAGENVDKLAVVAGAEAQQALGVLGQLRGTLGGLVGQAASFAKPMSDWLEAKLPGFLGTADKVTGVVATGADAFNAYRYLGAVLVAEELVARAKVEVAATERAEAERAAKEAEERRARSAQREDYSLDAAVPAASAQAAPIKYTRTTEVAPTSTQPPAKAGCMGCGAGLFFLVVVGGVAAATMIA